MAGLQLQVRRKDPRIFRVLQGKAFKFLWKGRGNEIQLNGGEDSFDIGL